jgi:hypothetical protein
MDSFDTLNQVAEGRAFTMSERIRCEAFRELLARPDPADLPQRGHRYTCWGHPTRRERIKRELAAAYVAYRSLRHGEDATGVAAMLVEVP